MRMPKELAPAIALLLAAGCATQQDSRSSSGDLRPVNTGLSGLLAEGQPEPPPEDPRSGMSARIAAQARAAADAQQRLDELNNAQLRNLSPLNGARPLDISGVIASAEPAEDPNRVPPLSELLGMPRETRPADTGAPTDAAAPGQEVADAETEPDASETSTDSGLPVPPAPAPEPLTPEEALDLLVERVLLAAAAEPDPQAQLAQLAALEAVRPGVLEAAARSDPDVFQRLFDEQRQALETLAAVVRAAADGEQGEKLAGKARDLAEAFEGRRGFAITEAQLCTRVEGFGRFTPFEANTFLSRVTQPAIVYTELDGFGYGEAPGGGYEVRLSQELELRHAADDLLAWRRPAETITDRSQRKIRDFYLINRIELPSSLTVGRYRLKVITRDLVGEGSEGGSGVGPVAEAIIPIEIVADRSLVGVTD